MNIQNYTYIKNILFFLAFSIFSNIFASKLSNSGDSIENDEAFESSIKIETTNNEKKLFDFLKIIKTFTQAKNQNFYIVGLGDYTDRCQDGVFVLSLLAQLKMANPDNVFLLKGNHENINMNYQYGLHAEFCTKFFFNNVIMKKTMIHF